MPHRRLLNCLLIGGMLCGTVQACATKPLPPEKPATVVVTVKDTPPPNLTACPVRIKRPASSAGGVLPEAQRRALGDLAVAYDQAVDQLVRLIGWNVPGACGTAKPGVAP